jgi:SAM-dependent methyltransferase
LARRSATLPSWAESGRGQLKSRYFQLLSADPRDMDKAGGPESPYTVDPQSNVWLRPGSTSSASSADVNVELAAGVIRAAHDVACGSEELLAAANDWSTQYHFGPDRSNILRPVRQLLQGRVLEIGSECGALTRFLGETESDVAAFEPDVQKAIATAARCRGLNNVTVFCDEFARAAVTGHFKAISLIGGLEYSSHPAELLEQCSSLLADDGVLLIAVENRLALKNFAGAPEDNAGIFRGIAGLDNKRTGRSFGRRELREQLLKAGLTSCEFLYPLPNYRFARLILHPDAFQVESGGLATDLVQRFSAYYDPRWNYERLFSERRAWATVLRNGLGEDLAPSFLVLASRKTRPLLQSDVLAYSYSTTRRRCFQKENILLRKRGKLFICRSKVYNDAPPAGGPSWQELHDERYQEGRLWVNDLHERLDKPGWTFQTILDWFQPYFDFLMQNVVGHAGRPLLPANFLDCTPFNIIRKRDGAFVPFDLEWVSQEPVPLDFLLFRGLFYTLNETITVARPDYIQDLHVLNIMLRLMASVGLQIDGERVAELFALEETQQKCAAGDHATVSRTYWTNACLTPRIENVREELKLRDGVIEQVSQQLQTRYAEQAAIQRQLQDRDQKVAFLDEQAAKRETRVEELIREAARQEHRAVVAEAQAEELSHDVVRNEERALTAANELVGLRQETASLSTALTESCAELRRRDEALAQTLENAEKLTLQLSSAEYKLVDLKSQLDSQTRAANYKRMQFERRAARLDTELRTSQTRVAQQDRAIGSAAQQLSQLEHDVEAIRASWSWRLTLPLRKSVDLIKAFSKLAVYAGARLRFAWVCRSTERRQALGIISETRLLDDGYYLLKRPDVQKSGIPPLVHYVLWGAAEGRNPHPLFDAEFYREQYADTDFGTMTPLEHYLWEGWKKGKDPHPLFSSSLYLQQNPDVARSGMNPLVHYLSGGSKDGRWRHPLFDVAWYLKQYLDVSQAGTDPLVHYLLWGAKEGRDPGPLFDSDWYLAAHDGVTESGLNPLVHYVRFGRHEGRATRPVDDRGTIIDKPSFPESAAHLQTEIEVIRPFFDVEFYLRQCPELELSDISPYEHYLKSGAAEGKDPHPLFDTSFYLESNPDISERGTNPLVHFAMHGGNEGRDPHPLFDSPYYLETYRDVAKSGLNPLLHYILSGASEGRRPNRLFDGLYYLRSNPDVAHAKVNALVHFINCGAAERRNPHPAFDIDLYLKQHPELAKAGINPLTHHLRSGNPRKMTEPAPIVASRRPGPGNRFVVEALEGSRQGLPVFHTARTVLCVTHVPPYPPRAGNEYAEYRQLDYLERHGYRIVIALSPLPGEELSSEQFRTICDRFPYTILCHRDGVVQHRLPEGSAVLDALDGVALSPLGVELGEELVEDPRERWLINTERTFCHDFLARLAIHLEAALSPCIVLSMYIFQTRFLPLITRKSLKVVDTIDMFSTAQRKVVEFGVKHTLNVTAEQERGRLLRTDLILACQHAEAEEFTTLVPERRVLEVPFDFDIVEAAPVPLSSKILYVASDNALNTKGLRDFLCLAWPVILREWPEAELLVAGRICRTVKRPPEGVKLLGLVDDLKPLYEQCKMTINPAVAGTGMKIKTAESLSYLRPVVGWPAGVDGFRPELADLCFTARDWPQFAGHVMSILRSPKPDWFSAEQKDEIRRLLSPDTIYGTLLQLLDTYSEQQNLSRFNAMVLAKGRQN